MIWTAVIILFGTFHLGYGQSATRQLRQQRPQQPLPPLPPPTQRQQYPPPRESRRQPRPQQPALPQQPQIQPQPLGLPPQLPQLPQQSLGGLQSFQQFQNLQALGGLLRSERKCNDMSWAYMTGLGGYSDNACVWYSREKASYIDAVEWCEQLDGAHLAEVPTFSSNHRVFHSIPMQLRGKKFWIGLTDMEMEGNFKWLNKKRPHNLMFPNFINQQPPRNLQKNCVYLDGNPSLGGVWNDEQCDAKLHFICMK